MLIEFEHVVTVFSVYIYTLKIVLACHAPFANKSCSAPYSEKQLKLECENMIYEKPCGKTHWGKIVR